MQRTAKKCTKIYNARVELLYCSLNLLFSDILDAVADEVCILKTKNSNKKFVRFKDSLSEKYIFLSYISPRFIHWPIGRHIFHLYLLFLHNFCAGAGDESAVKTVMIALQVVRSSFRFHLREYMGSRSLPTFIPLIIRKLRLISPPRL